MATQVSTKVRLVRCPKCRQVLAELPDVRLYKCGGCGTVLQAKMRKVEANPSEPTDSVASVQQDNAPEEEHARSSNHDSSSLQKGDSLKENGDIDHQYKHLDGETASPEGNGSKSTDSVASVQQDNAPEEEHARSSNHDSSSSQKGDSWKENGDIDHQYENLDGETASPEGNGSKSTDSVASVQQDNAPEEEYARNSNHDSSSLQKGDSSKENGDIDHQYENLDGETASPEGNGSESTDTVASVQQDNAPEEEHARSSNHDLSSLHKGDSLKENGDIDHQYEHLDGETASPEGNGSESTDSVASVQQDNAPEEEHARSSNHVSSSLQKGDSLKENGDIDHQYEHLNGKTASPDSNTCQAENSTVEIKEPSTHDDEAKKCMNPDLDDHTRVDDSEVGESQRLSQKGDGVVYRDESMPENSDQAKDGRSSGGENGEGRRHRHVPLEKEEKACSADKNGGLHGESMQTGLDSSSARIHENADASQFAKPITEADGDLETEPSASVEDSGIDSHDYGHLYRPMRKFRQYFGSSSSLSTLASSPPVTHPTSDLNIKHGDMRSNFPTTRYYCGYDGSESSYDNDRSPQRSSHPSRRKGAMVQRLDAYNVDEMLCSEPDMNSSKLPFTDATESPSIYKRNMVPRHPGFRSLDDKPDEMDLLRTVQDLKDQLNRIQILRAERQIYADASLPRYHHHLCNQERHNVSRSAFSQEAAHFGHQINSSCRHCCPQDWRLSAQLPSGYCGVHMGRSHCNVSSFSTPEHYTSSELSPWAGETQINDMRRRDREMQRLLREKYHTANRHIRPVAGGAPVVPCYHCSELLQLPVDFLLSKKRYHQLKCGACGKILRFSLLKNKHIVPHLPDAANQRNFGSMSDSSQRVEHVSRDQGNRNKNDQGHRNKNRKVPSGSSYDLPRDPRMKSIMKECHNKNMNLVESFKSVEASSGKSKAASSQSETRAASKDSSLHRLMGYDSARHVLNK